MTTTTPESRGRILYTTYCRKVGFAAFNGEPLPEFERLGEPQRSAWILAADVLWDLATTGRATL